MCLALHFSKTVLLNLLPLSAGLRISSEKSQAASSKARGMENHCLLYFMNDSTLLVLLHMVTHDYREVLGRLHMPTGTVKPHSESLTLTKAPNSH